MSRDHVDVGTSLNNLASLYQAQGKYAEAEPLSRRVLAISEKILGPDHPGVATSLNNLASLYQAQGKYAEAEPLSRRVLAIREKILGPDHPDVVTSLNTLASLYQAQSKYAGAEPLFRRSLAIREKALGPDHPDVATSLNNLAELYHDQGKYVEAEPLSRRALAISEKTLGPDHHAVGASLNTLALLYQFQGEYAEAEPLYRRSLAISEKALGPDHLDVATSLDNLAILCYFQGKYGEAEPLSRRALAIREKILGPDHLDVATSQNNLAGLYEAQGKYAEAEPLFRRSLAISEKALGPDHPDGANFLSNQARLYRTQGKYAEADPLSRRALAISEKILGPDHPDVAKSLIDLAHLEAISNRLETALSLMQRALRIDEHTMDNVFSLASEREKFAFLGTVAFRFEILQNLVAQKLRTDPEAVRTALDAALRRKGLVLEALSREREALLASANPDAAGIARRFQGTCSGLASLSLAGPGKLLLEVYRNRLTELEVEKERLEKELSGLSKVYEASRRSRQVNADSVVQALQPGTVLVEYVGYQTFDFRAMGTEKKWGAYRYLAFVLPSGKEAHPALIDLGEAAAIDEAVRVFRQEVTHASETISRVGEAEAERLLAEKGKRVYELAFAPLRKAIGESRVLHIAPDGALNLIPFGVLPDERGRYLAETYQLNYLSSGRDLLRFGPEQASGTGVMVLADPDYDLSVGGKVATVQPPGGSQTLAMRGGVDRSGDLKQMMWRRLENTGKEAEAIGKALGGQQVQVYVGGQALEEVVKGVRSPRILHLATHGFFLEDQDRSAWLEGAEATRGSQIAALLPGPASASRPGPGAMNIENPLLRSGLVLAGANRLGQTPLGEGADDGILTALEVSGMSLWGTDLVVLSACETGVGEALQGEGVFGLRRAFQLAGARTVVMSLWSVPDEETAGLMVDFYGRLKGGKGKSQALREAMLGQMRGRRERVGASHPYYWGAFVCVGEP